MIKVKLGKIKFDDKIIRQKVASASVLGVQEVAKEAAFAARFALVAGSGGIGLATRGYRAGEISDFPQYPHVASGNLLGSIQTSFEGNAAVALTDAEYASELNYGRAPGYRPSVAELESWATTTGATIDGKPIDIERLADRIERRGMAGTGFWTAAEDAVEMKALDIVGEELRKKL
jgi:hypothetical protein